MPIKTYLQTLYVNNNIVLKMKAIFYLLEDMNSSVSLRRVGGATVRCNTWEGGKCGNLKDVPKILVTQAKQDKPFQHAASRHTAGQGCCW